MNSNQVQVAAVAAADRFFSSRLWQQIGSNQVFAIEPEGRPPIAVCVLGSAGREYGLSLLLGQRALEEMLAIGDGSLDLMELESRAMWFSLTRRKDIDEPFDRALVAARHQGRMAPLFMTKEAGQQPRPPRKDEFEILLEAMQTLAIVAADGDLDFECPPRTGLVTTLIVRGTGAKTEVEQTEREAPAAKAASALQLVTAAVPPELAELPAIAARYAVAAPEVPMRIEGEGDAIRVLIVADLDEGTLATIQVLDGDPMPSAREKLFALLATGSRHARRGRPSTMLFCDRALYALVGPELLGAGVDCRFEPDLPEMAEIIDSLGDHLLGLAADESPDELIEVDGPEDLDGWKAVDHAVSELLAERGARTAIGSDKAWRRYLGCTRDELGRTFEVFGDSILTGFLDWHFHCYRATSRSRTIVERVLAEDLAEEDRTVITARDAANLSVYRVEAIEAGEGATLLDVLSGTTHYVTDEKLSLTGRVGLVFPARVYRVGAFEFALPVGPAIPPLRTSAALRFLESECGLQLGGAIAAGAAHLLGRLWAWIDRPVDIASGIVVQNVRVPASAARTPEEALEVVYMGWLDTPVPDLGGQTPRQACATAAGRSKVARMIRSYPDPVGSSEIRVPRTKMLTELGLLESGADGDA